MAAGAASFIRDELIARPPTSGDCGICRDGYTTPVITPCSHIFCRPCLIEWLSNPRVNTCPMCRHAFYPIRSPAVVAAEPESDPDDDETLDAYFRFFDDFLELDDEYDDIFQPFSQEQRFEHLERARALSGIDAILEAAAPGDEMYLNGRRTACTYEDFFAAVQSVRTWSTDFNLQNIVSRAVGNTVFNMAAVDAGFVAITMLMCYDTHDYPGIDGIMSPTQIARWVVVVQELRAVLEEMNGTRVSADNFVGTVLFALRTRLIAPGAPTVHGGAPQRENMCYREMCRDVLRFLHYELFVASGAEIPGWRER